MKYYLIKYTDKLSEEFGGETFGPLIKLREKYKGDKPLIEHEKFHVRQWYATSAIGVALVAPVALFTSYALAILPLTFVTHQLMYKFVRPYRQWSEVSAYKVQIKSGNYSDINFAVDMLASNYDLKIDKEEARKLLG